MDDISKDYILDKAMTSIASFAAAARIVRTKLNGQMGLGKNMTSDEALKYLVDFMEEESEKIFNEYDESAGFKKKVSRGTTYIELIPEAPFNPEDKEDTIDTLKNLSKEELFHLYHVYDKSGNNKFITIEEFEKDYYYYWEILLKSWNFKEEDIEKFKQGIRE